MIRAVLVLNATVFLLEDNLPNMFAGHGFVAFPSHESVNEM